MKQVAEKERSALRFILRYPKNREEITGVPYEPWHIRYVTKPLASWLTITNLTLEEYHNFPARCFAATLNSNITSAQQTCFTAPSAVPETGRCADKNPFLIPQDRFLIFPRRITEPMASLAHRIGCIIFPQ